VSEKETTRLTLQFAEAAGITLESGLDALNKQAIEGKLTQQQLASSATDLVELFGGYYTSQHHLRQ
jgi:hypothetical protein